MGQNNKGLNGVESIRLGGMSIDKLPIAEAAITKQQWPSILEDNRRQEADNIAAEYPKTSIKFCMARIEECEQNIQRIRELKSGQNKMINEYTSQISLCQFRDSQLAKLNAETDKAQMDKLKQDFPAYDIEAMKQQITQCEEAIVRSDEVIDKEHASIAELKELIAQCKVRDEKLKPYGVVFE